MPLIAALRESASKSMSAQRFVSEMTLDFGSKRRLKPFFSAQSRRKMLPWGRLGGAGVERAAANDGAAQNNMPSRTISFMLARIVGIDVGKSSEFIVELKMKR